MVERIEVSADRQQKIRDTFRQTYFVSQGEIKLQNLLFDWIAINKFVSLDEQKSMETEWLQDFCAPKMHHEKGYKGTDGQRNDPKLQWEVFHGMLRHRVINLAINSEEIVSQIFDHLLRLDLEYQILKRPNRPAFLAAPDTNCDPHKSYIRHYVLEDNYKSKPFDKLFAELKIFNIRELIQTDPYIDNIAIPVPNEEAQKSGRLEISWWAKTLNLHAVATLLVSLWEKNHPGYKFFEEN